VSKFARKTLVHNISAKVNLFRNIIKKTNKLHKDIYDVRFTIDSPKRFGQYSGNSQGVVIKTIKRYNVASCVDISKHLKMNIISVKII